MAVVVNKNDFCVIKFKSSNKIFSVPRSWISVDVAEKENNDSGNTKVSCLWSSQESEAQLICSAIKMKKPGKEWTRHDVEILAKASNVEEAHAKEKLAKSGTINIDTVYAEHEMMRKRMRSSLKRKQMDDNYTDGKGLSSAKDSYSEDSSEDEKEDEKVQSTEPIIPTQKCMFQGNNVEGHAKVYMAKSNTDGDADYAEVEKKSKTKLSQKRKRLDDDKQEESYTEEEEDELQPTKPIGTPPKSMFQETEQLNSSVIRENHEPVPTANSIETNDISSHSPEKQKSLEIVESQMSVDETKALEANVSVDTHTWHVACVLEAEKWQIVPSSWVQIEKGTCLYPPAEERKKTVKK